MGRLHESVETAFAAMIETENPSVMYMDEWLDAGSCDSNRKPTGHVVVKNGLSFSCWADAAGIDRLLGDAEFVVARVMTSDWVSVCPWKLMETLWKLLRGILGNAEQALGSSISTVFLCK